MSEWGGVAPLDDVTAWIWRWREHLADDEVTPEDEARLVVASVVGSPTAGWAEDVGRAGRSWGRARPATARSRPPRSPLRRRLGLPR